jgi:photosystem II stability/assembly factor-like uncharacterized protein
MKYLIVAYLIIVILHQGDLFSQQWRGTNGPSGGEVRKIIINPENEAILYAITSTAFSGVFKTINKGETWFALTNGLQFNEIDSGLRMPEELAIDFSMPDTLYVAINQPPSIGASCLYRSTNGGEEWCPIKTDRIFALCAKAGNVYALNESGLLYSSNAGETWHIQNPSSLGDKMILDEQNILWIVGSHGLFRSSDSGRTYQQFTFTNMWQINAFDVRVFENQKLIVVSVAGSPSKYDSLYISYDEGTTWINRTQTLPYEPNLGSYKIPTTLKISHHNINHIFAGSSKGFFRTTDGGIQWVKQDSGLTLPHVMSSNYQTIVSSLEITQKESNVIFAGTTNDGIYRSIDEGITWQFLSMPSGNVSTLSVSVLTDANKIYCSSGGGVYFFEDSTWRTSSLLVGQIIFRGFNALGVSPLNSNCVLVGGVSGLGFGQLYKTTDAGTTWLLKHWLPEDERFSKILFDKQDSNRVYACSINEYATGGLFISDDMGEIWGKLFNGNIIDMTIDPKNNQRLYVLERWGAIHLSTDKGETWNVLRNNNDSEHTVIQIDPTNPQRIYVGSFNLWVSEDFGVTWGKKSFNKKVTDVCIDSETGELFVGTLKEGVWRSADGGNIFTKMPMLPSKQITKLLFYIKDGKKKLMAGTNGVGAYEYDLGPILSAQKGNLSPTTFVLSQNYPNPFNPETTIEYFLPQRSNITLKIYDVLGREIKTLVAEDQVAGKHVVQWNSIDDINAKTSSGIYFCVLRSSKYIAVMKMLLLQ